MKRTILLFLITAAALLFAVPAYAEDYYIGDCYWVYDTNTYPAKAKWEKPEDKTKFVVQLYRGTAPSGKEVGNEKTVSGTSNDFTSLIVKKGTGSYYFTVFSLEGGLETLVTSEELEVDAAYLNGIKNRLKQEEIENAPRGWHKNPNGKWTYRKEDGTLLKNCWYDEGGKRYFFDNSGYMLTGWQKMNGTWYYFDKELGHLWVNTVTPDGYTVNGDGIWVQDGQPVTGVGNQTVNVHMLSTVTISVKDIAADPGVVRNVGITATTGCEIVSCTMSKPYEKWKAGDHITASIHMVPQDGYAFESGMKVRASGGTIESNKGGSAERDVKVSFYAKKKLETPSNFSLLDSTTLTWNKVTDAKKYSVKVYNADLTTTVAKETITENHIDLHEYIDDAELTVKVQATGSNSSNEYLIASDDGVVNDFKSLSENNDLYGRLKYDSQGRLYFKNEDGEREKGWKEIGGIWYLFDEHGYAKGPGWVQDGDYWYYFDSEYRMVTGSITENGKSYYLNNGSRPDLPIGAWVK